MDGEEALQMEANRGWWPIVDNKRWWTSIEKREIELVAGQFVFGKQANAKKNTEQAMWRIREHKETNLIRTIHLLHHFDELKDRS